MIKKYYQKLGSNDHCQVQHATALYIKHGTLNITEGYLDKKDRSTVYATCFSLFKQLHYIRRTAENIQETEYHNIQ